MFTFFIGSDLYTEDPDGSKHKIEEVMCTNNLRHIKQALFMSLIFFKKIKILKMIKKVAGVKQNVWEVIN
jgi:hypothetical protein